MVKKIFTIFLLSFLVTFLYSQQYVDIATAKNKISELEKTNSDLSSKSESLRKEIADLREKNKNNEKQIDDIRIMLDKVGVKSSALYYYSKDISDLATKNAAQDAYKKNKDMQAKLEKKSNVLKLEVRENNRNIEKKEAELSDYLYKIDVNTLEIRKYESAINKTSSQNDLVNSYVKSVDDYSAEVDALLK
ncbi:MAG TPA: hypothetical protein PLO89_01550 [Spirochaetota bacterium]|nr:hypothetical protein [Spirochaetota bacterium]